MNELNQWKRSLFDVFPVIIGIFTGIFFVFLGILWFMPGFSFLVFLTIMLSLVVGFLFIATTIHRYDS